MVSAGPAGMGTLTPVAGLLPHSDHVPTGSCKNVLLRRRPDSHEEGEQCRVHPCPKLCPASTVTASA